MGGMGGHGARVLWAATSNDLAWGMGRRRGVGVLTANCLASGFRQVVLYASG